MSWSTDNSANRYVKTYLKDWLDISGSYLKMTHGDILINDGSMSIKSVNIDSDSATTILIPDLSINNTLSVNGPTTLSNTLDVAGTTTLSNTLDVTGNTEIAGTLDVTGTTVVSDISATSSIKVGNTTITDDISSNSLAIGSGYNEFTVNAAGNTEIAGTLDVTGTTVVSDISAESSIKVGNTTITDDISSNSIAIGNDYTKFTVDATGNTEIAGTLNVDNIVSVNPRLIIDSSNISDSNKGIGSLTLENTYVDSNIVYRPDPSSTVYTHFDKSIALTRPSDYRNYYIGMVGNGSDTSNRFAIAGDGSGVPDPDIGFVMDPGGNVAIGSSLAINRDIVNNSNNRYELDVSGDTRLKGSLNLGSTANEFTVDSSGNTVIAGTLNVAGTFLVNSTEIEDTLTLSNSNGNSLIVAGDASFNNEINVGGIASFGDRIQIDSSGFISNYDGSGSLIIKNAYVDTAMKYRPNQASTKYTHFDKSILLTRTTGYGKHYIGLIGDGSTGDMLAFGATGGPGNQPGFTFGVNASGRAVLGKSLSINRDINENYELDVSGDTRLQGSLGLGANANEFTVDAAGNTEIAGTLDVTGNLTLSGNLTVNGTTTTLDTQNLDVSDSLIGLSHGLTGIPVNDAGILINRGDSSNVFMGWDESEDKFTMGTTLATSSSTGNLTITPGTLVADLSGNAETVTNGVYTNNNQNITGTKTFRNLVIEQGKNIRLYGTANEYSIGLINMNGINGGKGFNQWTTRFYMANNVTQGFLFTNVSNTCLLSIRASDGLTYINGNTGIGFDPSLSPYTNYKLSVNGTAYASDISAENSIKVGNTSITNGILSNSLSIGSGYNEFTVDATGNTEIDGTLQVHSNSFEIGGGFGGSLSDTSINFPRGSLGFSASAGDHHVFLKTSKELQFFTNDDSSPAMKIDTSKNVLIYGRLESEVKNTYYTDTSGLEFAAAFYNDVKLSNYGISFEDPLFYEKVPILLLQNHRGAGTGQSYDVGRGVFLQLGHGIIDDGIPHSHHHGVRIESISQKSGSQQIGMEFRTFNEGMNSVPAMRINHNNRVGIGTTAPGYTLDVSGTCNVSGTSTVTYDNFGDFNWIQTIKSPTMLSQIGTNYSAYNNKIPVLSIQGSRGAGNGPGAADDKNTGIIMELAHSGNGVRFETLSKANNSTHVNLEIRTCDGDNSYPNVAMVVSHDDCVGIGIRDPVSTLDVSGDTRLKGSLNLGSTANEFTVDTSGNTYIDGTLDVSGVATAPTANPGTNSTQIATTAFVDDAVSNIELETISAGTNGDEFTVDSSGNTEIAGTLVVTGDVSFGSTLTVTGTTVVSDISATSSIKVGSTSITDDISSNSLAIGSGYNEFTVDTTGNTEIAGTLDVTGTTVVSDISATSSIKVGSTSITDDISSNSLAIGSGYNEFTVDTTGNTEIAGTLDVTGTTVVSDISATSSIKVGSTSITDDISSNSLAIGSGYNEFTVDTTGNTEIAGTLDVTGTTVVSDISATSSIKVGNTTITNDISSNSLSIGSGYNEFTVDAAGNTEIAGTLDVTGTTVVSDISATSSIKVGNTSITDDISSNSLAIGSGYNEFTVDATGNTEIAGTLDVTGTTVVSDISATSSIKVGNTSITDGILSNSLAIGSGYNEFTVDATGNTEIAGTLDVTGTTVVSDISATSSIKVGSTSITGDISSNSLAIGSGYNEFTVDATGNTEIAGTLDVTGTTVVSDISATSSIKVGNTSITDGISSNSLAIGNDYTKFTVASTGNTEITGTLNVDNVVSVNPRMEINSSNINSDNINIASLILEDTYYDNSINYLPDPSSTVYTHFDKSIALKRSSNYRYYYIGMVGNNSSSGNRFAIGGNAGGKPWPNIGFALDANGHATIGSSLAINRDINQSYTLDVSGTFRLNVGGNDLIKTVILGDATTTTHSIQMGNSLQELTNTSSIRMYKGVSITENATNPDDIIESYEYDRITLNVGKSYADISQGIVTFLWQSHLEGGTSGGAGLRDRPINIFSDEAIVSAAGVYVYSDKRIKKDILTIDDDKALNDFRKLNPCTYSYIDTIGRGTDSVYGFIAQEVKEVLPNACTTKTETIPNIYSIADISDNFLILTNGTFDNLEYDLTNASGNVYTRICIAIEGVDRKRTMYYIKNIVNSTTIELYEEIPSSLSLYNETTGKNQCFVFGQFVNNFNALDKNVIWTVAAAATQEIDRQQQRDKVRIAELENEVSSLNGEVSSLNGEVSSLNGEVSSLNGEVSSLNGEVSSLKSQLADVLSRVSVLENA